MKKTLLVILYLITLNIAKADETKIFTLNSTDKSSELYISCFKNYEKQNETCLDTEGAPLTGKIQIYDDKIDKVKEEFIFEKGKVVETISFDYFGWNNQPIPTLKNIEKYKNDKNIRTEVHQSGTLKRLFINKENIQIQHYFYADIALVIKTAIEYSSSKHSYFFDKHYSPKFHHHYIDGSKLEPELIYNAKTRKLLADGEYSISNGAKLKASFQVKDGMLNGKFLGYTKKGFKEVEIIYKKGKAISGYQYQDNIQTKLTPAHLYNINKGSMLGVYMDNIISPVVIYSDEE